MRNRTVWVAVVLCTGLLAGSAVFGQVADQAKAKPKEAKSKEKAEKPEKSTPGVVPVFSFSGEITEAPQGEELSLFGSDKVESLQDLLTRLRKARDDKQVRAVVLLLGQATPSLAQVEEIRKVLDEIKAGGKAIYAHADSFTLRNYVLACGASKVSVVPTGDLWVVGLSSESPYLRGLLDKLGVKPDFLTCGAYKSAAETFMRTGPSPQAHEMQNWLLDSLYDTSVGLIASGRKVPAEKVRGWIDRAPYSAAKAKELGLIDAVEFRQDLTESLKKKYGHEIKFDRKYGKKKGPEMDLSSPLAVFKLWSDLLQGSTKRTSDKDAVAIVYVEGPIVAGKAGSSPLLSEAIAASTPISKALDEAAADAKVKAVVLRVNSPGGSATGSEIILNATKRVKAKKPLVVSMGGVAGSGGYYVACGSDTIYADDATITASIGVVGGKFATTDMWNKIGVAWKANYRGANAGMLSTDAVFTPEQREKLQAHMNETYATFKQHVAAIRGKRLKKPLDEIAGGRVYTGRQALDLGLIDKIGGLQDAIHQAARQANLKDYDVRVLPRPKSLFEALFEDLGDKESDSRSIALRAGSNPLWDAALPYLRGVEPRRLATLKAALDRMTMLQQETVLTAMPEIDLGK